MKKILSSIIIIAILSFGMTSMVSADATVEIKIPADKIAVVSDAIPGGNLNEFSEAPLNRVNLASYKGCPQPCTTAHAHDLTAMIHFTIPNSIAEYVEEVNFNIDYVHTQASGTHTFTVSELANTDWDEDSTYNKVKPIERGNSVSVGAVTFPQWYSMDITDMVGDDGDVNIAFNAYYDTGGSVASSVQINFAFTEYQNGWGDDDLTPYIIVKIPITKAHLLNKVDFGNKKFFQKNESGMKELDYDEVKRCFIADDKIGIIGLNEVMPSDKYSMVMRYSVTEDGRYRIYGNINPADTKGDGTIIKIYKNDELIRQGYYPAGEDGSIDIRMLANKGDVIDVEASIRNYVGHNYAKWNMDVIKVPSAIRDNITTTVLGTPASVVSEKNLSDYLGSNKPANVRIYTTLYGVEYDMEYNTANKRWQLNEQILRPDDVKVSEERERLEDLTYSIADSNYVSESRVKTSHNPTSNATTYIEVPVEKDGTIMVDGKMKVNSQKDGELVKVYLNNELLWSNRLGGEVSVRYDEPYESKFFVEDAHAVANVKQGDVLKFVFNRWRYAYSTEYIDISDIKIKYIVGDVLSENTRWLLENSIIVDTHDKSMYINGKKQSADVRVENGTTYISSKNLEGLFGDVATADDNGFVPLRTVAETAGKNVVWTANRLVIIHDGIDGAFTYNELSEIDTKIGLKGGDLFD